MENLALVLGGGAARGAFHLGVLHFCEQNNIDIKAYSGSSIGSIIAVSHASGVSAKEQLKIYSSKEVRKVLKFNYFNQGLLKIDETNKIIKDLIPISKLEDLPKPVYINAYDLKEKKLHYFNSGDSVKLCLASSALIPLFRPIKYNNMYLIDGGLFDRLPIKPLENKGYEILSIDLFPRKENKKPSRTLNPIKAFKRRVFKDMYENHTYSIEHTHYYLSTLELKKFSLFTFEELEECFNLGAKEARKHFLDIL